MENEIKIKDNSGDKECFTILPNYIANHSTANEQALYFQMKRFAGEEGKCFATEKTLMKKLGIGKRAYDKSLEYLISKNWVSYIGLTDGKTRPIKTYKINNIWKLNNEYYKKISAESNVSFEKDKCQKEGDKCQKQHKISAESNVEEDLTLLRVIKKKELATPPSVAGKEINNLIELFKTINPSYERLFSNKTERASLERLVKKFGIEKAKEIINCLPNIFGKPYAPRITTPYQLEQKLGDLMAYLQSKRSEEPHYVKIK